MISQDTTRIGHEIMLERERQDAKWGTSFPDRPTDVWVMIAMEEMAEALREPAGSEERYNELIQLAAVVASWAEFDHEATDVDFGHYVESISVGVEPTEMEETSSLYFDSGPKQTPSQLATDFGLYCQSELEKLFGF